MRKFDGIEVILVRIMKKRRQIVEEISFVVCDWCKKKAAQMAFAGGFMHIHFGYPSDYDCQDYCCEICDECFKKHILRYAHEKKK